MFQEVVVVVVARIVSFSSVKVADWKQNELSNQYVEVLGLP